MAYDPTPDLLSIVQRLPKAPYSVSISTRVGSKRSYAGRLGVTTSTDGTVQVRVEREATSTQDRADIIYEFKGDVLTAVDRVAHEVLRRRISPNATWDQRLTDPLGLVRDPVLLVLDRTNAAKLMRSAAKQGTWNRTNISGGTAYRSSLGRVFTVDNGGRLAGISVGGGSQAVSYVYGWQKQSHLLSPLVGRDYVTVASFTEKRSLPKSDAKTQETIRRMLRAHQRFTKGTVSVDGVSILLNGRSIGERQTSGSWAYTGGILSIRNASGKFTFRKPSKRDEILPTLTKQRFAVDPYTRNLLNRNIPFRDMLLGQNSMRTVGVIGSGASALTIVQVVSSGRKLSLTIGADGRVRETESVVQTGLERVTSTRRYSYDPRVPVIKN